MTTTNKTSEELAAEAATNFSSELPMHPLVLTEEIRTSATATVESNTQKEEGILPEIPDHVYIASQIS